MQSLSAVPNQQTNNILSIQKDTTRPRYSNPIKNPNFLLLAELETLIVMVIDGHKLGESFSSDP